MVALQRINEALLAGQPARLVPLTEEERKLVQQLCLLTMKPVIFAANVAETELADSSGNPHVQKVKKCAADLNAEVVVVSAQVHISGDMLIQVMGLGYNGSVKTFCFLTSN